MIVRTALFAAAAALIAGAAAAQSTVPKAPVTKPAMTTAAKPSVARTPKSLECSKQADGKGLHGKARKGFMSSCKKA